MAERLTIYAGEPIATALAGFEENRSARLNQIAADYQSTVSEACPALELDEWKVLLDVLSSTDLGDDQTLRFLWAALDDSSETLDKWNISPLFVSKIRGLSKTELIALREILWRAWNLIGGHDLDDAIKLAGARVT